MNKKMQFFRRMLNDNKGHALLVELFHIVRARDDLPPKAKQKLLDDIDQKIINNPIGERYEYVR